MQKTFVISLGGSLVCPEAGRVDTVFLKKFRAVVLRYIKRGNRFAIIVGGGKLARVWQNAARTLGVKNSDALDWVGIRATQANMELVRVIFGREAVSHVVMDPHEKPDIFRILFGAGFKPGVTSDYDAVVRAKTVGAHTVINLSNVPYVYDKDPRKHKSANPLRTLSWTQYLGMIGGRFAPGMNAPFDPIASKTAYRAGISVAFMDGRDVKNFERFLQGKKFNGTIIS